MSVETEFIIIRNTRSPTSEIILNTTPSPTPELVFLNPPSPLLGFPIFSIPSSIISVHDSIPSELILSLVMPTPTSTPVSEYKTPLPEIPKSPFITSFNSHIPNIIIGSMCILSFLYLKIKL